MLESIVAGLLGVIAWPALGLMLVGVLIGWVVGLLPGLGAVVALALMLPFTFSMEPIEAFAFLLGMFATAGNAGELTSILFGVPGESTTAATILDGHPMTLKGQAGRAMGASLMSSVIGAFVGVATLAALIPIVRPFVLRFAAPEMFALTILGVSFVASLSGRSLSKGVLMAGLGFMIATVGMNPQTGVLRYTFGQNYLWAGVGLVPIAVGMFAVPEVMGLFISGSSLSREDAGKLGGVMEGVKDTFRHFWLVIRSSAIGVFVGIIPGLGGSVSQWLSYGHAVQSAKDKSLFGRGDVRGVLAPGAASNAKEGGSLVPTVAFGVPGSVSMAILLGAFLIAGLTPGPEMLTDHLDVVWSMVWVIVLATVVSVATAFLFLNQLVRLTRIQGAIMIPFLVMLVWMGAYTNTNHFGDLVVVAIFGALGFAMALLDWPRPPLILGVVLGGLSEKYLFIASQRYGLDLFTRPIVIAVFALAVASLAYGLWQARRTHGGGLGERQVVPSDEATLP